MGCSWPGVFLLGASGRAGRFFTQLLFHHPHSLSSFFLLNYNKEVKCVCHNCSNKCSDLSYIALPFWFQDLLGPYVFWV